MMKAIHAEGDSMTYRVILHTTAEGVSVQVPALPGCWSEGTNEAEALDNVRDAIREYVAAVRDLGAQDGAESREVVVEV